MMADEADALDRIERQLRVTVSLIGEVNGKLRAIHGLLRDGSAPPQYTEIKTVDAIDQTVVDAMVANDGWTFLHAGTGSGGQTTLTFGWGAS